MRQLILFDTYWLRCCFFIFSPQTLMIASHSLERKKQCLKIWFTSCIGCRIVTLSVIQCIILRLKNNRSSTVLLLQWCYCFRHWNTTHFFGTSCLVCRKSTQVHLKNICIVILKYFKTDRVDQQLSIIFINERLNPFVKCVKYLINHPNMVAYHCWWLFYLLTLLCFTIPF